MLYGVELQSKNMLIACMFLDPQNEYSLHLECADSLKFDYWGGMKFDVIIGNPPYQKSDGGHSRSYMTIYHIFIQLAQQLSNRYVMMVTPSRWMMGGKGLIQFREHMTSDTRLRFIVDTLSYDIFDVAPGLRPR